MARLAADYGAIGDLANAEALYQHAIALAADVESHASTVAHLGLQVSHPVTPERGRGEGKRIGGRTHVRQEHRARVCVLARVGRVAWAWVVTHWNPKSLVPLCNDHTPLLRHS